MGRALRPGEEADWGPGKVRGSAAKRPGKIKSPTIAPARDDPDYQVEDDKSGKRLAQRRSTSKKT